MLKLVSLLISFFLGRYDQTFKKSTVILIDQFILKSRKLFIVITLLGIFSLLFATGLLASIYQLTSQYDNRGYVNLNAGLISATILTVLSFITLLTLFSASAWENRLRQQLVPTERPKNKNSEPLNAFEHALTLLVTDFVKERELQRSEKYRNPGPIAEPVHADHTQNPSHQVMN